LFTTVLCKNMCVGLKNAAPSPFTKDIGSSYKSLNPTFLSSRLHVTECYRWTVIYSSLGNIILSGKKCCPYLRVEQIWSSGRLLWTMWTAVRLSAIQEGHLYSTGFAVFPLCWFRCMWTDRFIQRKWVLRIGYCAAVDVVRSAECCPILTWDLVVHHWYLCVSAAVGSLVDCTSSSRGQLYNLSVVSSCLECTFTVGPVKRSAYWCTCTTFRKDKESVFGNFNITIPSQTFVYFALGSVLIYCTRPLAAVCY